jgi:hypothetical protein
MGRAHRHHPLRHARRGRRRAGLLDADARIAGGDV